MEQSTDNELKYKNYGEWLRLVEFYVDLYQGYKADIEYSKKTNEELLSRTIEQDDTFISRTQADMDKVKQVIDELLSSKMFSLKYQLIHQIKNSNFFSTPQGRINVLNKLPQDLRDKFYPLNEGIGYNNELKFPDPRSIKLNK